jgi:FkbM family methyltransferase
MSSAAEKMVGSDLSPAIFVKKNETGFEVSINEIRFAVPNHWFWERFSKSWEPQTYRFFERNILVGSSFLDIGGWVGPTSMIATALGATFCKIVEPNPISFANLVSTQMLNSQLIQQWMLVNALVSNSNDPGVIGPINALYGSSSTSRAFYGKGSGAKIISLTLDDLVKGSEKFSLAKIDIEGSEEKIFSSLPIFCKTGTAVWLSLHPPLFKNAKNSQANLTGLSEQFFLCGPDNKPFNLKELEHRMLTSLSTQDKPEWGTEYGNTFEIGLLPKSHYHLDVKNNFYVRNP